MTHIINQASYHYEIGHDQYEVVFKRKGNHYMVIVYRNNQRKNSFNDALECSPSTASDMLNDYLTTINNTEKLF